MEKISENIIQVIPLLKKRLNRMSAFQGEHSLPLSHYQVLSLLDERGSMSVSEISEYFDIAKPNITPLIDRMIEAGYVKRVRNSTDRRVVHVIILEKGREKVKEMIGSLRKTVEDWSSGISNEDMNKITQSIDTIRTILEKSE